MPLARIITDSVDDSLELTIQLRSRGFQVETVAPGTIPSTPADLEVRLEECASEDALSRASQNPTQDDLWVFVAPGALDERVRLIREIPIELMAGLDSKVVPPSRPIPSVAPVLPLLTPEDDPILAELVELKRAGDGQAQPATPTEPSPEKAEIVVFPTVGEPLVAAESRVSLAEPETVRGSAADREPTSAANLRFWRIATMAAGLAITALLVGANMSRQPNLRPAESLSATTSVQPVTRPLPGHATEAQPEARKSRATRALSPSQAKGAAPVGRTPQVAKVIHSGAAKPRRRATPSHADSIIAEDTVVFYDRKPGLPSGKGPEPGRKQPGRN
jgi:hypothetical protein